MVSTTHQADWNQYIYLSATRRVYPKASWAALAFAILSSVYKLTLFSLYEIHCQLDKRKLTLASFLGM
jgi:hypothetical protein